MDIMRKETLEEMLKNGRAYRHEIQSIAHELLERRAGRDPTAFDGLVIQVPRTMLVEGYLSSSNIHKMKVGETRAIRLEPNFGKYAYYIMHRMPEP